MKRYAILLVRVSTLEQDYQAQIYDLELYGKSLGYTDFKVIETKETAFADLSQKVGTNQMFKYIEEHPEYNTILMTELSRLARRQSILHAIKEHCINKQIQIYIKDLNFKLLDNYGKIEQQSEMIFTLYGMFAESEVKQKLERFSRKRKELMQQGLSIGGKLLFGYDRLLIPEVNKKTLVINDEQANIVREIFNWYLNGLKTINNPLIKNPSVKLISLECVKRGYHPYTHSKRNVNKLLKEQAYTGEKITSNKRKNPKFGIVTNEPQYLTSNSKIKYPPIIDSNTYDKVQVKLKSNIINSDKETKHTTLLAKLITCPSCGRKLQGNYRKRLGDNKNSYRCTSRGDTQPCDSRKSLSMPLIDSAIWSLIKADLPTLSKKMNEINPDEHLVELDFHLNNFLLRENEIKNEIEENVQIIKSMGKLTSTNVIELVQSAAKKIEKLETDLSKIEQEKSKIESNKLLLYDKQDNVEAVINDNLATIEASKELLKKYINSFIYKINIIEHNVKYTVLEVTLSDYKQLEPFSVYRLESVEILRDLDYIILDKTVTRNIKGAYYKRLESSTIYTPFSNDELNEVISNIKIELESNKFEIGNELNFEKLNI